jgi:hypothetical protein
MAIEIFDVSDKAPEDFPGLIFSAINSHVYINNSKIFPCNCNCYKNKVNIYLSPTNDGHLNITLDKAFTFAYSIEKDHLFPFEKVIEYYLSISDYKMVQVAISFNQSCRT